MRHSFLSPFENLGGRGGGNFATQIRSLFEKKLQPHIGIREDWFRPIDLAKECDIYFHLEADHHIKKFLLLFSGLHGSTAADSVRSEWPLWHAAKSKAVFARRRSKSKPKQKLLDIRAELEREKENARGARAGVTF
ncbi:hypothetical protein TNCV_3266951 [Trichonephila clavipes]|nr:hypothetical protein TNCV_3266951 [Trichonephila clavipes]